MKKIHNRCKEINLIEMARSILDVRLVYLFNIDVKDIDLKSRSINVTTTEGFKKNIIIGNNKLWKDLKEFVFDVKGLLPGEKMFFNELALNNIEKSRYFLRLKKEMGLSFAEEPIDSMYSDYDGVTKRCIEKRNGVIG